MEYPQGSILGPLLFLLYINYMKQTINCDLFLYADDSCLFYQQNDKQNLNKNFFSICDWFFYNKLSTHAEKDKKKCILFGRNQGFLVWVRLLAMCRGELSAVIAQLMCKCLSMKQVEVAVRSYWNVLPLLLQSCDSWMFVKKSPQRGKTKTKTK